MAHVNSITRRERDGYYLYSDQGVKLGGPFASSYEADSLAEYLSDKLGERPVEEYQNLGSQMGYREPQTSTFEGTPNPWGDLPTERKQADFRRETRGIPSEGFDWRNILPNTTERFQGLFEPDEANLFDYNPKAELQEELKRTGLEEQYLQDRTRYSGPEPPEDRGWTSRFSPFSEARASTNVMQPMSSKAGLGAAGLIDMSSFDLERQLSFKKKSYEDIAIDFIKDKESYGKAPDHDKVFDDFGTDRIGYGRSPDPGETTTTRAKEDTWLQSYVKDLGDFIDDVVTINLLPNQKAALISLVFNVGKDAFKISYALKALNLGDMEEFKKQAFSKNHGFVTSNGNYVPGLYNRRQSEQDLFFN